MWQYNYTDELIHYGVPGMKWGHRKAQPGIQAKKTKKTPLWKYESKKLPGEVVKDGPKRDSVSDRIQRKLEKSRATMGNASTKGSRLVGTSKDQWEKDLSKQTSRDMLLRAGIQAGFLGGTAGLFSAAAFVNGKKKTAAIIGAIGATTTLAAIRSEHYDRQYVKARDFIKKYTQ